MVKEKKMIGMCHNTYGGDSDTAHILYPLTSQTVWPMCNTNLELQSFLYRTTARILVSHDCDFLENCMALAHDLLEILSTNNFTILLILINYDTINYLIMNIKRIMM